MRSTHNNACERKISAFESRKIIFKFIALYFSVCQAITMCAVFVVILLMKGMMSLNQKKNLYKLM